MRCDIDQSMENAKEILLTTGQLRLKVTPRAGREEIGNGMTDENGAFYLPIKTRAVPEDGKANAAVVALLASSFNLPKSRLEITRGATARYKTIAYRA